MNDRLGLLASVLGTSVVFVALAPLTGCGGQPQSGAKGAEEAAASAGGEDGGGKHFDFDAAIKREASGLSDRPVQGPDGAFSAKVPAAVDPKLSRSDNITV